MEDNHFFLHSSRSLLPVTLVELWVSVENDITLTVCTSRFDVILSGQRLFRRSGVGSDSFSETSSIGQAEETTRDGSSTQSGSIHPPTSPPIPKEDSHTACDVTPEKIQESSVQEHSQVEDEVASEERQPEGPEVEQSER